MFYLKHATFLKSWKLKKKTKMEQRQKQKAESWQGGVVLCGLLKVSNANNVTGLAVCANIRKGIHRQQLDQINRCSWQHKGLQTGGTNMTIWPYKWYIHIAYMGLKITGTYLPSCWLDASAINNMLKPAVRNLSTRTRNSQLSIFWSRNGTWYSS